MWWSFSWRAMVIGFGLGFIMGFLYATFVGTPTTGFLVLIQLVSAVVGGLYAMKLALKANEL